ncbi:Mco1 [Trypoxylus dichotomus]
MILFSSEQTKYFVTVFFWTFYALSTANDHPCYRTCVNNQPMECVFNFTLEFYYTMSKACYSCPLNIDDCSREDCVYVDGVKRSVNTVNRQIPGPSIEVCEGDTVVVNVANNLISESTTIHWHGQHQLNFPYMDGVPYVTQCPIQPGSTFTYKFTAVQTGTQFWHAHSGLQRGEGIFGPLIIRTPEDTNQHIDLYDYDLSEHVIIIHDWTHENGLEKFLTFSHSSGNNKPDNILVNGKGRSAIFTADDGTTAQTPLARFVVDKVDLYINRMITTSLISGFMFQGYRYRFRIINTNILNCPIEISVDDHTLIVISLDGNDIEPQIAESLVTLPGERYDVIINADQEEGLYWIRFRGLLDCDPRYNSCHQEAVLQYAGFSDYGYPEEPSNYGDGQKEGLQINSLNVGTETRNGSSLSIAYLSSVNEMDDALKGTPDFKYVIELAVNAVDHPMFHKSGAYGYYEVTDTSLRRPTPQVNHITMLFKSTPLLSGRSYLTEDSFCNVTTLANSHCESEYCGCTHVEKIPLNSLVELIFVDSMAGTNHPIHLHGYSFRVVGMEHFNELVNKETILEMDEAGLLPRNFDNPPLKDTANVPASGYTIVRFIANNPGYWFLHCHLEYHTALGMGLVFQTGENDEMLDVPNDFPQCGDYSP